MTSRPDNVWPDMWKQMLDASKRKAKQKWAIEKPKLDNVVSSSLNLKLEIPMTAATPCKSLVRNYPGIIVRQRHADQKHMGLL